MRALWPRLLVALLRVAVAITGRVPRPAAEWLCRWAGRAWWLAAPSARAAVRANLRQVLGRAPSEAQVRQVFFHGALNYWDTLAIPQLSRAQLEALVLSDGWEHLNLALAQGKGAVMVGAHLGSLALAAQLIGARGYRVTGVVEPVEPRAVFDLLTSLRSTFGLRFLPLGPAAAHELLAALRRGEIAGLIADRDVLGSGPTVDLLGAPTRMPDGPAVLALRTGAPVLVAVAWRGPEGRFQAHIEPLSLPARAGDPRADTLALVQAIADRLGYHIAAHPEQWTVFQRRWPAPGVQAHPAPVPPTR